MAGTLSMPTVVQRVAVDAAGVKRGASEVRSSGGVISKFFGGIGGLVRTAGLAFGGFKLVGFLTDSVKAASNAQTTMIKWTGAMKASGLVTAEQSKGLREYAEAMQTKTKFDDESILSGEAQLSIYKLNGDQIKSTIPLVLDYASRLGTDVPTAAKKVGLALNGNMRGLKALGIEFKSTGNRGLDLAIIQDLLRKKVGGFAEKEGKSYAGRLAEMHNMTTQLKESVGNLLLPSLTTLAGVIVTKVLPPIQQFVNWIGSKAIPIIKQFAETSIAPRIETALDLFDRLRDAATKAFEKLRPIFDWLDEHKQVKSTIEVGVLGGAAATGLISQLNTIASIGGGLAGIFGGIFGGLGAAATGVGILAIGVIALGAAVVYAYFKIQAFRDAVDRNREALIAIGAVMTSAILGPLIAVGAAFVFAYNKVTPFRTAIEVTRDAIVNFVQNALGWITGTFVPAIQTAFQAVSDAVLVAQETLGQWAANIITFLQPSVDWINENLVPVFVAIGELFTAIGERLLQVYNGVILPVATAIGQGLAIAFTLLRDVALAVWEQISAIIRGAITIIGGIISGFIAFIQPVWSIFWNFLFNLVSTVFTEIRIIIETVLGVIRGIINVATALIRGDWSKAWEGIKAIFSSIWNGIKDTAVNVISGIVDFVRGLPKRIEDLVGGIKTAAGKIGSAIKDGVIEGVKGAIKGALDLASALQEAFKASWNWLVDRINQAGNTLHIPTPFGDIGVPHDAFNVLKLAMGGLVTRPTLALLGEAGPELVVPLTRGAMAPRSDIGNVGMGDTFNYNYVITGPNVLDAQTLERTQRRADMMRYARRGA